MADNNRRHRVPPITQGTVLCRAYDLFQNASCNGHLYHFETLSATKPPRRLYPILPAGVILLLSLDGALGVRLVLALDDGAPEVQFVPISLVDASSMQRYLVAYAMYGLCRSFLGVLGVRLLFDGSLWRSRCAACSEARENER